MIKRQTAFVVGNKVFGSLEEAQAAALAPLFSLEPETTWSADGIGVAETILRHRDTILEVLTTTPTSLNAARKINGGTKKRKPKVIDASETAA